MHTTFQAIPSPLKPKRQFWQDRKSQVLHTEKHHLHTDLSPPPQRLPKRHPALNQISTKHTTTPRWYAMICSTAGTASRVSGCKHHHHLNPHHPLGAIASIIGALLRVTTAVRCTRVLHIPPCMLPVVTLPLPWAIARLGHRQTADQLTTH